METSDVGGEKPYESTTMGCMYHGSPERFEVLREGSTITPHRAVAEIFSHRPSLVFMEEDSTGWSWRHNGKRDHGYLYTVDEVGKDDIIPHPSSVMPSGVEWVTLRPLRVSLIGRTVLRPEQILTDEEASSFMKGERGIPPAD